MSNNNATTRKLSEQRLRPVFEKQNRLLQKELTSLEKQHLKAAKLWDKNQRHFTYKTLERNSKMASILESKFQVAEEQKNEIEKAWKNRGRRKTIPTDFQAFSTAKFEKKDGSSRRPRSKSLPFPKTDLKSDSEVFRTSIFRTEIESIEPFSRNLGSVSSSRGQKANMKLDVRVPTVEEIHEEDEM